MNIKNCIENHPLWQLELPLRQRIVFSYFKGLVPDGCPVVWSCSLFPFATQRPLTYARHSEISKVLAFLCEHKREALEALANSEPNFSRAVNAVVLPGPSWPREGKGSLAKAHELARFENLWHAEYQRYVEHAFNHLINIPLGVLSARENRDFQTRVLAERVGLLKEHGELATLTEGFDPVIRNAIAHGQVEFSHFTMRFRTRRETREISSDAFLEKFDALVRSTTELLVGCVLFLLHSWETATNFGVDRLPLGLHQLALAGGGCHQYCVIERIFRSQAIGDRAQINLICSTESSSRAFHQLEALRFAGLAQDLAGGEYDRASLSFECGRAISSSAFLDLRMLDKIRGGSEPFGSLDKVFEGSLLWHDTSSWRRRIDSGRFIASISWKKFLVDLLDRWNEAGIEPAQTLYLTRDFKNLSVGALRRLEGVFVWSGRHEVNLSRLRRVGLHAAAKLRRFKVKRLEGLSGETGLKRRPSHIWFRLFARDDTLRRLVGRGGKNPEILMEGEWKKRSSKSGFVFVPEPSEVIGGVRLRYFP